MHNIRKITDDLFYIGCSDRRLSLFESAYPLKNGVSYNSYILRDEKMFYLIRSIKHALNSFMKI